MRVTLLLCAVAVSGCQCEPSSCTSGTGGDAGAGPRTVGEPCDEGSCADGLGCVAILIGNTSSSACSLSCADGGTCPAGTVCSGFGGQTPFCLPSCLGTAQCTGRFFSDCIAFPDAGLCVPRPCLMDSECPSSLRCVRPLYCCPPGAPCVAPRPGVCVP